tara:strand:+ start:367 stop:906 length:540 start_codon:yes stop_codon:yes gene_type:complete
MNTSLALSLSAVNPAQVLELKYAKEQSNVSITNFTATWTSSPGSNPGPGGDRQVRAVASGVRSSDQLITLLHFNSSHFELGMYLITFDVTQASGTSINDPISGSERSRIEVVTRDNSEVEKDPDSLNKDRFAVKTGSNSITAIVFNDGSSSNKPQIQLFFQRSAIFDVTISNIKLQHYS